MTSENSLGETIRAALIAKHGSVMRAASVLGIRYERLKFALRKNVYKATDLAKLREFWETNRIRTIEDLEARYQFKLSTRTRGEAPATSDDPFSDYMGPLFSRHNELKAAAEPDLTKIVADLYENWAVGMAMVLFCDKTAPPIEWHGQYKLSRRHQIKAIEDGGIIVYVAETRDDATGVVSPDDEIDRSFSRFVAMCLREVDASFADRAKGFVALLRVPQCAFCTPHQKHALFTYTEDSAEDDSDPNIVLRALTAIEIPDTVDGHGSAGTIVAPQMEATAQEMDAVLRDLVTRLDHDDAPADFRVKCFPEKNNKEFVDRLLEVL